MADEADETAPPRVWLVDGFNALHVAVLRGRERAGWGTREGREQLLARVRGFDDRSAEIWVVFDGPHPANEAEAGAALGGPRIAFAHSADAWLLQRVRESRAGEVAVVTADRPLAARARARGARVVSPRDFLARCGGASKES
jgi:predicted RNA-binding protein with PIN domain